MATACAPTDREDITRVISRPIVKSAAPSVESYMNLVVLDSVYRGAADKVRILLVDGFQFLSDLDTRKKTGKTL